MRERHYPRRLPRSAGFARSTRMSASKAIVGDLNASNAEELLAGYSLILDGTDNFETRFLMNDYSVKSQTPWIYAAAVSSHGLTMTIRPGKTPASPACWNLPVELGMEETCDTVGVLGPIVNLLLPCKWRRL